MLAVNTHRGLYAVNRMWPGVKPASGIFQQIMEKIFVGLEKVYVYFDDILVATEDWEEHKSILREVFRRLRKFNVRAGWEKCRFFQVRIKFLGTIIDGEGIRPDMDKIEALVSMPPPINKQQLHSFLGAVGFYLKYVKGMSDIRAPLDAQMKKDIDFNWTQECHDAFLKFKQILQSDLLLCHYDPTLPITIASDASQYGIGAVAYHTLEDGAIKAFYHISRKLTSAEVNYAQIEKEALAIIFAVKKFHVYVWGRRFSLKTDHKPLLAIFNPAKGVPQHTASRLQRWALILMAYDYDIDFVPTEEFGHADFLSRLIADRPQEDFVVAAIREEEEWEGVFVTEKDFESPVSFADVGVATEKDAGLQQVIGFVRNGWPSIQKVPLSGEAKYFYQTRQSLSLIKNVLVFRERTVIPLVHRDRVLHHLHATHPGMSRMKELARAFVYWPGINEDIENTVRDCVACEEQLKAPVKTELRSWPVPSGPWQRVHMDYFQLSDQMYLLIVDAFSKWPEVFHMTSTTSSRTVEKLSECCGRYGSMITLVSDNGPQFTSEEMATFCSRNNVQHIFSPPYHPQSNGQAEIFVATFKSMLIKGPQGNVYLHQCLQRYRATRGPHTPTGASPSELFLGRRMLLPMAAVLPSEEVEPSNRNEKMEKQFNQQHHVRLRVFEEGEEVLYRQGPKSKWARGVVVERVGSVVYNLLSSNKLHRVHTNQMRPYLSSLPEDLDPVPVSVPESSAVPVPRRNPRAVTRSSPPVLRPRRPK